jgi:hypothetical protein
MIYFKWLLLIGEGLTFVQGLNRPNSYPNSKLSEASELVTLRIERKSSGDFVRRLQNFLQSRAWSDNKVAARKKCKSQSLRSLHSHGPGCSTNRCHVCAAGFMRAARTSSQATHRQSNVRIERQSVTLRRGTILAQIA